MSKFDMGMGQDQHQSIQDHQQQLCPTLMVEHYNPTTLCGVNINELMPPSTKNYFLIMPNHNTKNNISLINGWLR
jgi:hypothetical protein